MTCEKKRLTLNKNLFWNFSENATTTCFVNARIITHIQSMSPIINLLTLVSDSAKNTGIISKTLLLISSKYFSLTQQTNTTSKSTTEILELEKVRKRFKNNNDVAMMS